MTLHLVTTCDLVRPFSNLLHKTIQSRVALTNLVTVFAEAKTVTKLRLHCTGIPQFRLLMWGLKKTTEAKTT